jgi:hypothetical protein
MKKKKKGRYGATKKRTTCSGRGENKELTSFRYAEKGFDADTALHFFGVRRTDNGKVRSQFIKILFKFFLARSFPTLSSFLLPRMSKFDYRE